MAAEEPTQNSKSESASTQVEAVLRELPRRRREDFAKDAFYEEITTAVKHAVFAIKWLLWPVTIVVVGLGVYYGLSFHEARQEIAKLRHDATAEFGDLQRSFTATKNNFVTLRADYDRLKKENEALKAKGEASLAQNQQMFKRLDKDSKGLSNLESETRDTIKKYEGEIQYAKQGADKRKEMADQLLAASDGRMQTLRQVEMYYARYAELTMMGRNHFPDPNAAEEVRMLNKILETLRVSKDEYENLSKEQK